MRFSLWFVTVRGYIHHQAFEAQSLAEAAAHHIEAYRAKRISAPLIMRRPDGKRSSFNDSLAVCRMDEITA